MPLIDSDLSHPVSVGHLGWLDIISPLQPFLPSCPTAQALAEKKKRNRTFIDPVSEVSFLFDGCYPQKNRLPSFVKFTSLTTASLYFAENQQILTPPLPIIVGHRFPSWRNGLKRIPTLAMQWLHPTQTPSTANHIGISSCFQYQRAFEQVARSTLLSLILRQTLFSGRSFQSWSRRIYNFGSRTEEPSVRE